jgi:phosphate transport system substrate-binding protein
LKLKLLLILLLLAVGIGPVAVLAQEATAEPTVEVTVEATPEVVAIELPEVVPAIVTGDIVIDGSSTVGPLVAALQDNFQEEGYSGNISLSVSGTGGGFKAFCEEMVTDIATASRAITTSDDAEKPGELEKCLANGREPIPLRIGTDGIAIVTNKANDFATDLTREEIAALFSTAVNWSDVRDGFPDEPIIRYVPGTDSGTFDYFNEVLFEKDSQPLLSASKLNQSEDDNVLALGIEGNQFAIGFFGYAYYEQNTEKLNLVAIDGVLPTLETVESGEYSLARPLYLYTTKAIMAEKPQVAAFLTYVLTNVDSVIEDVGYFPTSVEALNKAKLDLLAATSG